MAPQRSASQRQYDAEFRAGWRMAAVSLELVSEVAAGLLIGYAVDWYLGTDRWMAVGGIAGIAVGMLQFIRAAFRINRQMGPVARQRGSSAPADQRVPSRGDDEGDA